MGADLSRVRFDARADINKVVQQQGRVVLDSDGNEQADLLDRRMRAQSADLGSYGPLPDIAGTAVVPRTTPDAFKLSFAGTALMLGRGRMYVDGVLAENHGTGTVELDPLLAELRGAAGTPYLQQPYWPNPDPLPTTGRHVVYLEVRERELTWVEDPELIDPAIAVDTTARTQVIWQVRVHAPAAPGIDCDTRDQDIPGWAAVIAPTTSRLTVGTVPVPPALNPCSLPPSGDYRGLENQTYRVEVHQAGAGGTATFKWSRDNGSVTVPVTEVTSSSRLRLASLGKDTDALGLASGQWVEVLDDDHELAGQPGEMRQITVHPEDRSVSFNAALPAGWPTTTNDAVARHLRVRRWDGSTGTTLVPAVATAVELEHGITVTLTATGGGFRTGEYWVFTARTATTSVEQLTAAPPLGPPRHVARIGIIEGSTVISEQCVPLWPAECECDDDCACTVCVSPEDHADGTLTIQDGLDLVRKTGGTVCLSVGTYQLEKPLVLAGAAGVRLRGQGSSTLVTSRGDALLVDSSVHTTVEDFRIVSAGEDGVDPTGAAAPAAALRLVTGYGTTLSGLTLEVEGGAGDEQSAIALHDLAVGLSVHDNDIHAPVGLRAAADLKLPLLLDGVTVAGNRLDCASFGVLADEAVLYSHDVAVRDNRIEAGLGAGVQLGGVVDGGGAVRVAANHVNGRVDGIVVTGGVTVQDNTVTCTERGTDNVRTGISAQPSALPGRAPTAVVGNTVTSFDRAVAVDGAGEPVRVSGNEVAACGTGIGVTARTIGVDVQVCENVVRDIGLEGGKPGVFGVQVSGAGTLLVADNTVGNVGTERQGEEVIGIGVLGTASCRLIGNVVHAVGFPGEGGESTDYAVSGVLATTVQGNQSFHDTEAVGQRAYGLRLLASGKLTISGAKPGVGDSSSGQVLFATDDLVLVQALGDREVSAIVGENTFTGGDLGAAIDATIRGGTVQLSHNHCTCPRDTKGAVQVSAPSAAVTGNRVRGGAPSMLLNVSSKQLTVLGNLVSNGISAVGGLDPRWAPLNLDGVS